MKPSDLIKKADSAFNSKERLHCRSNWKKLSRYVMQSLDKSFFSDEETPGVLRNAEVYEATPGIAARDLASAIHATLTNPAMRWSKFRFKKKSLNDNKELTGWLDDVSRIIHEELNESNFDSQISSGYQSLTGLGMMVLMHESMEEEGTFKGFRFKSYHLGEVALETNKDGKPDTLYRKFKLTPKQAMEMFPDAMELHDRIMKKDNSDEICFYHIIMPRDKRDVKVNELGLAPPEHRPIASLYLDAESHKILREDGYYELPFYTPRWQVRPSEVYGFGPGHTALPDIMSMNTIRKDMLKGLAKAVNPPVLATQRNVVNGDLRPGKLTIVRDMKGFQELITQTRFEVAFNIIEDYKNSIKSAFYIDKLLLPPRTETGEMTAYEVAQRLEQMQQILGPVISRLNTELLTPFIQRCYNILLRAGKLPPVPAGLEDEPEIDLDIVFVNSLARAQQMSELRNVQTWITEVAQIATTVKPEILDKIDFDEVLDYMSKIRGIPEKLTLGDKEVEELRQARAQQQQMQEALAAGEQVSNIAKNTGGIQ